MLAKNFAGISSDNKRSILSGIRLYNLYNFVKILDYSGLDPVRTWNHSNCTLQKYDFMENTTRENDIFNKKIEDSLTSLIGKRKKIFWFYVLKRFSFRNSLFFSNFLYNILNIEGRTLSGGICFMKHLPSKIKYHSQSDE